MNIEQAKKEGGARPPCLRLVRTLPPGQVGVPAINYRPVAARGQHDIVLVKALNQMDRQAAPNGGAVMRRSDKTSIADEEQAKRCVA